MEPGEIEAPNFKFEFKEGLQLNWRHIIDKISIPDVLSGQNLDSFTAAHLNFAYADNINDPAVISTEDPDTFKLITVIQLGLQYLLFSRQCNLDQQSTLESKHLDLIDHIANVKRLNDKLKKKISILNKDKHEIELAQAMLVDAGTARRPDLQHAIQKMMTEPVQKQQPTRHSKQSIRRSMRSSAEIINEEDEDLEREVRFSPEKDALFGGQSVIMQQTLKSKSRYNTFDESQ